MNIVVTIGPRSGDSGMNAEEAIGFEMEVQSLLAGELPPTDAVKLVERIVTDDTARQRAREMLGVQRWVRKALGYGSVAVTMERSLAELLRTLRPAS